MHRILTDGIPRLAHHLTGFASVLELAALKIAGAGEAVAQTCFSRFAAFQGALQA
jgi:hypothetical protein